MRPSRTPVGWRVRLAALASAIAAIWWHPFFCAAFLLMTVALSLVMNQRERRRLRALAESRPGESICSFVRALPIRSLDTWVVRAVFEELRTSIDSTYEAFPLRPSDNVHNDLKIDVEDFEDMVVTIAHRCCRRLENYKANPHYDKLATIEGLINFLCVQPGNGAFPATSVITEPTPL